MKAFFIISSLFWTTLVKSELVCPDPIFDFGTRDEGAQITHSFVLRNTGNTSAIIERIRTTCGCTVAIPSTKVVRAGETVTVQTAMNLTGRTGKQDKKIHVYMRGTKTRLELTMRGTSVPTIEIRPRFLYFGRVDPGNEVAKTLSIRGLKEPLEPGTIQCNSKYISCTLQPGEQENEFVITGLLSKTAPSGEIRDNLYLPIYGGSEVLKFPIFASITSSLFVSPTSIRIQPREANDKLRRTITLRPGRVRTFNILSVECPDSSAKTSIKEIASGGFSILIEELNPTEINGRPIIIRTDAEGAEEIHIPCEILPTSTDQ
jgi:hypothetical protein